MYNSSGPLQVVSPALIVNTMAEGVLVVDSEAVIQLWNPAMTEITGYSADEMLGQPIFSLRAAGCVNSQRIAGLIRGEGREHSISGCECRMKGKSGEEIPVLINARSLRDGDGKVIGVLQTVTDFRPVMQLRQTVEAMQVDAGISGGDFAGMIGRSLAMREIFRLLRLAAGSDATVLILGESGTGKELAAAAIHQFSTRRLGPLVKVNCGALPENLLESELFGHVKGAFTGAVRDRVGRFELAFGGTIFLDEIGELSPAMQVKLLRVIQEGEFERVGDSVTRQTDVRVVAATNLNLSEEVRAGRFREDLYYRLRVFPLQLPPLRERRDDIPVLLNHFMTTLARRTGKTLDGISPAALRACLDYAWPGNIRELVNTIEYAFVVCPPGGTLELEHLPMEIRAPVRPAPAAKLPEPVPAATRPARRPPDRAELAVVMRECGDNKAEVARRFGVSRTLVWKWLKTL